MLLRMGLIAAVMLAWCCTVYLATVGSVHLGAPSVTTVLLRACGLGMLVYQTRVLAGACIKIGL